MLNLVVRKVIARLQKVNIKKYLSINFMEYEMDWKCYCMFQFNLLETDFFFQILAHPVFKM